MHLPTGDRGEASAFLIFGYGKRDPTQAGAMYGLMNRGDSLLHLKEEVSWN